MKLVALLAVLVLAFGCGSSPSDGIGRHVAEQSDRDFFLKMRGMEHRFEYVVIDGHEYLMLNPRSTNAVGVTHSPKCPCIMRNREKGDE